MHLSSVSLFLFFILNLSQNIILPKDGASFHAMLVVESAVGKLWRKIHHRF